MRRGDRSRADTGAARAPVRRRSSVAVTLTEGALVGGPVTQGLQPTTPIGTPGAGATAPTSLRSFRRASIVSQLRNMVHELALMEEQVLGPEEVATVPRPRVAPQRPRSANRPKSAASTPSSTAVRRLRPATPCTASTGGGRADDGDDSRVVPSAPPPAAAATPPVVVSRVSSDTDAAVGVLFLLRRKGSIAERSQDNTFACLGPVDQSSEIRKALLARGWTDVRWLHVCACAMCVCLCACPPACVCVVSCCRSLVACRLRLRSCVFVCGLALTCPPPPLPQHGTPPVCAICVVAGRRHRYG